ncbi:class I SAM-dependent methyltransferase [Fluviicola sp.]|uniref:class I SAM-dependent methyltransferase n=1 Tax=Fluviicola sp. TaxID=1917219 RepID=UPI0031E1E141
MSHFNKKEHWENVYATKELHEVSWYQPKPETSLQFIEKANLSEDAKIIDVGGGDSFLLDHLLELGYTNITVVDISGKALERARKRLGEKADSVKWIEADVLDMELEDTYDLWHDRAVFHFVTDQKDIQKYISQLERYIRKEGTLVLGTFSENGPLKCSGIEIRQYSETSLDLVTGNSFEKTGCLTVDHQTPFDTRQNFIFCSFRKR